MMTVQRVYHWWLILYTGMTTIRLPDDFPISDEHNIKWYVKYLLTSSVNEPRWWNSVFPNHSQYPPTDVHPQGGVDGVFIFLGCLSEQHTLSPHLSLSPYILSGLTGTAFKFTSSTDAKGLWLNGCGRDCWVRGATSFALTNEVS
jgi:hypothetical protein